MAGTRKARVPMTEQIRLINECRQSGMTDADWCRENGIAVSTFYNWVSRCRKSVLFEGKNMMQLKDKELADLRLNEMGFIFQQMYMMKNLTILDNIVLPAQESKKHNETGRQKVQRAENLMRKLGIIDVADNDINEVSGGQLQRACICRSMMNMPKILFADEPTGALNRTSSNEVMEELTKLNKEGTTIMMVTHDAKVAASCSRVLYILDGNIVGEYKNDIAAADDKGRERSLNNWLMELGW